MFVNPFIRKYYRDYPQLNEHNRSPVADGLTKKFVKKGLQFKLIKLVDFAENGKMTDQGQLYG